MIIQKFPEIISFRITSNCNRTCGFCYGPKNVPELPFSQLAKIFTMLANGGAKSIVISGGEPLLRQDIKKILSKIHQTGLKIFLDTNADLFFRHHESINKYVDTLGLSLDNPIAKKTIGHPNQNQVIKVLDFYQQLSPKTKKPKIRIGTVVTRENIHQLFNLAELIKDLPIDYWKLYQVIPVQQLIDDNQEKLIIDEQIFLQEIEKILTHYGQNMNIIVSPRRHRANAYFLINPDGQVFMPEEKRGIYFEKTIGSIFDKDIVKRWQELVDESHYLENAEDTFSHTWDNYPMSAIYNRIWHLAKKHNYQGQEYTGKHIEWLINQSLSLVKKEAIDKRIFIPLILLHDIGYSAIEKNNPFGKDSRKDHMQNGKIIAEKILRQANYPEHLTKKIGNYIAIHDNWAFGDHQLYRNNRTLGLFNDLDFISMYSTISFKSLSKILSKNHNQFLEYLKTNEKLTNRPFSSNGTHTIYKDIAQKTEMRINANLL